MSRTQIRSAHLEAFDRLGTCVRIPVLGEHGGGWFDWEFLHPGKLLTESVARSAHLQKVFGEACRMAPPSQDRPWGLIIGFDEAVPGNKLKLDNDRKSMNMSFTFRELGQHNLSDEYVWMTAVSVRSRMLHICEGGWSRFFRDYLRFQLFDSQGLATAGVPLHLGGDQYVTIFAQLSNILTDGDGHRIVFDWKGQGSTKPCIRHFNVVRTGSDLVGRGGGLVEITSSDPSVFVAWSSTDAADAMLLVGAAARRVADGTMTAASYARLEQSVGLNFNKHGLLADADLCRRTDPIACVTWDWVHSAMQDGVFTIEAVRFLQICEERVGLRREQLEIFLRDDKWLFPQAFAAKASRLYRVFDLFRNPSGNIEGLRCQSSELLFLYGLLRNFVETEIGADERVAAERSAFDAACKFMDGFLAAKRGLLPIADAAVELQRVLVSHFRIHKAAHGTNLVRPKHHWLLDCPPQVARDGCVLDTFVVERIHLQCRRIAEHTKNTSRFERSVLAGITNAAFNAR